MRYAHVDAAIFNLDQRGIFFEVIDKGHVGYVDFHNLLDHVVHHPDALHRQHTLYVLFSIKVSAGRAFAEVILNRDVYVLQRRHQLTFQRLRCVLVVVVVAFSFRHPHIGLAVLATYHLTRFDGFFFTRVRFWIIVRDEFMHAVIEILEHHLCDRR